MPVTYHNGNVLFLVGKDIRDGSYSDQGGKVDRGDRDKIATACREFYEETYGLVIDIKQLRARMTPKTAIMLQGVTQGGSPYYMYVCQVPYLPHIRNTVRKLLGFLRSKNLHRMYVEKIDTQWVTLDMLKKMHKRPVFANTIETHMKTLEEIARSPPSAWRSICEARAATFDAT
jgi:8-oxo-dGTP pyrophosphatase MutT (NUDIX family)